MSKKVWFVQGADDVGTIPTLFDSAIAAERYARAQFPGEDIETRDARIFFRELHTEDDLLGRIKVEDLTSNALNWAVAKAAGYLTHNAEHDTYLVTLPYVPAAMPFHPGAKCVFTPSKRWAQGGLLIEQECIEISCLHTTGYTPNKWTARHPRRADAQGSTPLIAAMRCFVSLHLGNVVEIPAEFRDI